MANFAEPVSTYMTPDVHSCRPEDSLDAVHRTLTERQISSLAVVDDSGRLVGVVSRSDLLKVGRIQAGARPGAKLLVLPPRTVADAMTPEPLSVALDSSLSGAGRAMRERRVHRVFVTEGDELRGVLSTRDLMLAIRDVRLNHTIERYASAPIFSVRASEPISLATDRLAKAHVSGLVVVEDDWPVGVFTQVEAMASRDMPRTTDVEEVMNPAIVCMDNSTKMHRAAAQAAAMRVRRVVSCRSREMHGILTGLDFAAAVAG